MLRDYKNDLNLNKDLGLDSPYFNLTVGSRHPIDVSPIVDDSIVEGDEVICVTYNSQKDCTISETGNAYALLTVNDNDKAFDYTLIISYPSLQRSCRRNRLHSTEAISNTSN